MEQLKRRKRGVIVIVAVFLVAGMLYAGGQREPAGQTVTLKLHHVMNEQHPYHIGAAAFANEVREKSGGQIIINIYPNSQLGDDREVLELMRTGAVEMATGLPTADLAAFVPEMDLFNIPFLFDSTEQMEEFATSPMGQSFLDGLSQSGFKGLGFHSFLFRYPLSTRGPLARPEDFRGLKVRVMGIPTMVDTYRALGSSPTSIPFGELYTSLQTGVIDAVENDITTLYGQRLYEVTGHLSLTPVLPFFATLLMSQMTWDALTPEQQRIIAEAVPIGLERTNQAYVDMNQNALDQMRAAGVIITEPADLDAFRARAREVWEKHVPALPPRAQAAVNQILGR